MKIKYPIGLKDSNGKPILKEIEGDISFKAKVDLENNNFGTSLANAWRAEDVGVSEWMAKTEIEKRVLNWDKLVEALEVIATHTIIPDAPEDLKQQVCTVYNIAESALEEIEK